MHTSKKSTDAQWTVGRSPAPKSSGHSYVLREVSGAGRKEVHTTANSANISKSLVAKHLDMLKRLADR